MSLRYVISERGGLWIKHSLKVVSPFRLAVLGKLNNFVKEWIAEISELKVGSVVLFYLFLLTFIYQIVP